MLTVCRILRSQYQINTLFRSYRCHLWKISIVLHTLSCIVCKNQWNRTCLHILSNTSSPIIKWASCLERRTLRIWKVLHWLLSVMVHHFLSHMCLGGMWLWLKVTVSKSCRLKAIAKLSSEVVLQTVTLVVCYHASIAHWNVISNLFGYVAVNFECWEANYEAFGSSGDVLSEANTANVLDWHSNK